MADQPLSVSEVLHDVGAVLVRSGTVGRGLSVAEWRNRDSCTTYQRPNHHTLSLYLDGGSGVVREDLQRSGGGPDKVCVLPAGHESRWRIDGPLHMFHLYVEPETLAYQAAARFEIDPAHGGLMDLTFTDDPSVAMIVRGGALPLDWSDRSDGMAMSSACQLLIHRLLGHRWRTAAGRARGGLSPTVRRRIEDYVQARLADALTLDVLADEAGLSTYHFAKMFRSSFGIPPHRYVTECRIAQAKSLLAFGESGLADIAAACGFSSQSHFQRAFKQVTGLTPGVWRS